MKPRILFVCGRNQWRSPTAQQIYKNDTRVDVRSAGVSSKSKHPIGTPDLLWADLVLVMESRYKSRISELFRGMDLPPIKSLDIPDEYEFMDDELVELIKAGVEVYIKEFT